MEPLVQFVKRKMMHVFGYQLSKSEHDQDENECASTFHSVLGYEMMKQGKVSVYSFQ